MATQSNIRPYHESITPLVNSPSSSHFPLPTSSPVLPRDSFNHTGIGWLVPRSHAPLNVLPLFGVHCSAGFKSLATSFPAHQSS